MTTNLVSIDYLIILLYFVVVFLISMVGRVSGEGNPRDVGGVFSCWSKMTMIQTNFAMTRFLKCLVCFQITKGIVCPIYQKRSLFTSNRCLEILWQYKLLI